MKQVYNPYDENNLSKNYVIHDSIYLLGSINYTARYRLYNAISNLVTQKIALGQEMRSQSILSMPIIHIYLATTDEKEYTSQTNRLYDILTHARRNGVTIEVTIASPLCLNSWGRYLLCNLATPGFRNILSEAYCYYYPNTYDVKTSKDVLSSHQINVSNDNLLAHGIVDAIFLANGQIRTR